ncbi:hypothetical protein BX661DRAFT_176239 [Kickxella alabastrina]|uniref:uncharacterized protein n=1 Tax=Kickxella alabastrina TaxID=61397 RepID=UPI00221F0ACE|nr:uncharacterized protein BX661DRAFT_176239 [Kickxella alabastrina]KAI7835175.1 hypothetical protein BX661DRAFT_176239 [Kickxella alabastrina]KAJ1947578.1 hypothetical protein GGF37_000343 [Kickxella alabastrina]
MSQGEPSPNQHTALTQAENPATPTAAGGSVALGLVNSGLTQAQQEGIDRALAYARELQQTVFKEMLDAERRRREDDARAAPGTVNPGRLAGMDARNLSVMSRIYVGSINFDLTDEHIHRVFSEYGPVRSVSMSKDPASGRHRGYGFVEYEVPEAAALAVDRMNGTMLGGRQLKIGRPNNYNVAVAQGFPQPPAERIYVANVNEAITEDMLRDIFAPFGAVSACILAPDMATRKHRGWGFIEFEEAVAAEQAAATMDSFSLGNLVLRVSRCVVGGPLGDGMAALDDMPADTEVEASVPTVRPPQQVMDLAASINRTIDAQPADQVSQQNAAPQAVNGPWSTVVLLENVVGDSSEVDDDLASDMAGEGEKCGTVAKVVVHVASDQEMQQAPGQSDVCIFVQFAEPDSALRALKLFDGRWFGGRRISAQLYDIDRFRVLTSSDTMVYMP